MTKKTVNFSQNGSKQIPNDKPVIYKIQTEGGKTKYVGTAKKGRAQERIQEHLNTGKITGSKIQIQQMSSRKKANTKEQNIISRIKPKYNKQGK